MFMRAFQVDVIQSIPDMYNYGVGNESGVYPNYGQMVVGVPKNHPTIGNAGHSRSNHSPPIKSSHSLSPHDWQRRAELDRGTVALLDVVYVSDYADGHQRCAQT
jgi:hypothetical protein